LDLYGRLEYGLSHADIPALSCADGLWDWSFTFLNVPLNAFRIYVFGVYYEVGEARDLRTEETKEKEKEEEKKTLGSVFVIFCVRPV
jgi:hypothetical protein